MSVTTSISTQVTSEWVKLFPSTITKSYTSSVTFMKQLTVIAISTLSYLKDIFPEDNYKMESFGGYNIRILKQTCSNELAQFLSTSLIHSFEAFDRRYLHQLALCFYNGEHTAENLVEYHIFEYTYTPTGVIVDIHSTNPDRSSTSARYTFENIRDRTLNLIRACALMAQTTKKTDISIDDISLRLYYNENAPEDYQAPGFFPCPDSEDHLAADVETVSPRSVKTPYHRLKMHSFIKDLVPKLRETIASSSVSKIASDKSHEIVTPTDANVPGKKIRCLCNISDADTFDSKRLIICSYCTTYQHGICYGICPSDIMRVKYHCCAACYDMDPLERKLIDAVLAKLDPKHREGFSIFRRTLDWCSQVQAVSLSELVDRLHISQLSASKLMKKLQHHGIIADDPEADLTTPRKIIPEHLATVIQNHFKTGKHDIVDRLLAESLSQQQIDPVGDKLEPSEKMNLKSATTIGRVVDLDEPSNTVEDATLKQYREAIIFEQRDCEILPLSGSHNPIQDIGKQGVKRKSTSNRLSRSGTKSKKLKVATELKA